MTEEVDTGRRHFLTVATVATGAVGAGFVAVPFLASWKPSARAKAMGAPVEVDVSKLEPGALMKIEWRGKAVFIVHRTPQMLAQLEGVADSCAIPTPRNRNSPTSPTKPERALKPEYLVLVGVCTHLGCAPLDKFTPGDVTVPRTGRAASSARATVPSSTCPAASSRTCRLRRTWPCRRTSSSATAAS